MKFCIVSNTHPDLIAFICTEKGQQGNKEYGQIQKQVPSQAAIAERHPLDDEMLLKGLGDKESYDGKKSKSTIHEAKEKPFHGVWGLGTEKLGN